MPLLKRKAFEKSTASGFLRDEDEVFHCEITGEIFKDYEEYCERIILVNSMVWSCEMTGKPNLTYSEALESEKNALKSLRTFPTELRIPIIYLAHLTKRTSFADMSEDVFNFVRDRYFIGETIEACLDGDVWCEAHILSVTVKTQESDNVNPLAIPSTDYCYEVEQLCEDIEAIGQVCTVSKDKIRRKYGSFSREKNKLFLKQFVQQGPGGIIIIKPSVLEKFNIGRVIFDQIFIGSPPQFPSSKKLLKTSQATKPAKKVNDKKQTSISKYMTKPDKNSGNPSSAKLHKMDEKSGKVTKAKNEVDLKEKMKRAAEAMKQKQQEEKQKKIEKKAKLAAYVKEWNRQKEDLDLEDHKDLPKGTLVVMDGIPSKYVGDFLSVLEFVHLYGETLKSKDVFHNGFDVETLRKALAVKEQAYLFCDLIQMMLSCIFQLQEDEAEEYNDGRRIQEFNDDNTPSDATVGVTRAVELATKASKWPQTYLGTPLSELPLDAYTVTEVLRLHFLSSGANGNERCVRWRYQQRGGYNSTDDAGLRLRISSPHVIKALTEGHVADLNLDDKFAVLQCLMNQILSYATVRDIIEEKLEKVRQLKLDIKLLQIAERKRENELTLTRVKLKKEAHMKKETEKLTTDAAKQVDQDLEAELEKLQAEGIEQKAKFEKKLKELQLFCFDYTSYLGSDRAHRRYWLNQAVSGLFVEACEVDLPCRDKVVTPISSTNGDVLSYVQKLFEKEQGASDKENESNCNSNNNTPKKPTNLNGLAQKLNDLESFNELLVCTANSATCPVHGKTDGRPKWYVFYKAEEIEALLEALNKRGIRENDLKQSIETDKENIITYIDKCPIHLLSLDHLKPPPPQGVRTRKFQPSIVVLPDSTPTEALELSLRDYILELEEKVYHGCLGAIQVKDREAWRGTIMLRSYDKQASHLQWGPKQRYRDNDEPKVNGNLNEDKKDVQEEIKSVTKYRDPGYYLSDIPHVLPEIISTGTHLDDVNLINGVVKKEMEDDRYRKAVRDLASALLQVEQCINRKFLKRPLGYDEKERKDRDLSTRPFEWQALERWETSLMESLSFSQVALHYMTLDNSVLWSKSILNASCRLCRKRADAEHMLLCDSCNKGHHMYCLKPKLTKVPAGDWFCDLCKPKEKTPRKKRKLFVEAESDAEDDASLDDIMSVCVECGSGGRFGATCQLCNSVAHSECAKAFRIGRNFLCRDCRKPEPRRCAAEAVDNIRHYTRELTRGDSSESESSEDNVTLTKIKKSKGRRDLFSKESSPAVTTRVSNEKDTSRISNSSRVSNGKDSSRLSNGMNTSNVRVSGRARKPRDLSPVMNGTHEPSSAGRRKRTNRGMHEEAIKSLLNDVMKHKDSWPFSDPVDLELVPDYLDVVDTPMDLSEIKSKLENGDYHTDEQFMADAALVFKNCYTYNKGTSQIAKTGARLEKFFNKRCIELELTTLPTILSEEIEETAAAPPKSKKVRLTN